MNAQTTHFDRNQLLTELVEFRKAFTQRSFWRRPEVRQQALNGLTFVYLNCKGAEDLADLFQASLTEYGVREFYALTKGWLVS